MSRAAMRVLLCFLAPAAWFVVLNVLYVWARLQTGEWPGPWNHPEPTPFLGYCFRTLTYLILAVLAVIVIVPGVIWIRHTRILIDLNASARTNARQTSQLIWIWLACLGFCYLALLIDPLGAFDWMAD